MGISSPVARPSIWLDRQGLLRHNAGVLKLSIITEDGRIVIKVGCTDVALDAFDELVKQVRELQK